MLFEGDFNILEVGTGLLSTCHSYRKTLKEYFSGGFSHNIFIYRVLALFSGRRFEGVMKIRIVPAVGGGNPIELEVSPSTTIGAIRAKVCAMKKLPPDTTRLTYRGRALKDTETLESIGVQDGDKLILITRTVGG